MENEVRGLQCVGVRYLEISVDMFVVLREEEGGS